MDDFLFVVLILDRDGIEVFSFIIEDIFSWEEIWNMEEDLRIIGFCLVLYGVISEIGDLLVFGDSLENLKVFDFKIGFVCEVFGEDLV